MSFSDNLLRGLTIPDALTDEGTVSSQVFQFKEEHSRDDGWIEQSINWEENDDVLSFTLDQIKDDGSFQFKMGIVRLERKEIDKLNARPTIKNKNLLSYEKQPLPDNCYHGNILLKSSVSKPTKRMIAANLAAAVSKIIIREQ